MSQQALAMTLELLIKQTLAMNNASNKSLIELEQKTLTLCLAELNFPLSFTCHQDKILVTGNTDSADCTITTSIKALKKIKENHALTQAIKDDVLDIDGDLKVAQLFMAMAESIDIDWHNELAKHIGDIPTYKLEQLTNNVANKLRFATTQIKADASEWLVHENNLLVTSRECQQFINDVDCVTEQLERLNLRIESLDRALMTPQEKA